MTIANYSEKLRICKESVVHGEFDTLRGLLCELQNIDESHPGYQDFVWISVAASIVMDEGNIWFEQTIGDLNAEDKAQVCYVLASAAYHTKQDNEEAKKYLKQLFDEPKLDSDLQVFQDAAKLSHLIESSGKKRRLKDDQVEILTKKPRRSPGIAFDNRINACSTFSKYSIFTYEKFYSTTNSKPPVHQ